MQPLQRFSRLIGYNNITKGHPNLGMKGRGHLAYKLLRIYIGLKRGVCNEQFVLSISKHTDSGYMRLKVTRF